MHEGRKGFNTFGRQGIRMLSTSVPLSRSNMYCVCPFFLRVLLVLCSRGGGGGGGGGDGGGGGASPPPLYVMLLSDVFVLVLRCVALRCVVLRCVVLPGWTCVCAVICTNIGLCSWWF